MKKCPECGGKILIKKMDYVLLEENLGKFDTMVCQKCGEQYYDEAASDKIDAAAKKKGLWGLYSDTKLSQVGNSLAIRLNKKLIDFLKLKKGEEVAIYPISREKLMIKVPKSEAKIADK